MTAAQRSLLDALMDDAGKPKRKGRVYTPDELKRFVAEQDAKRLGNGIHGSG